MRWLNAEIELQVMSAFDNEADTKGMNAAPQGVWDNAVFYAEQFQIPIKRFRLAILRLYRGHVDTAAVEVTRG